MAWAHGQGNSQDPELLEGNVSGIGMLRDEV